LGLTEGSYLSLSRGRDELLKQDASYMPPYHMRKLTDTVLEMVC